MVGAELGEAADGDPILLVGPGKLQPEVALGKSGGGVTAGEENAQRRIAVQPQLMNARLQRAELLQSAARQESQGLRAPFGCAHRCSASNSAVV